MVDVTIDENAQWYKDVPEELPEDEGLLDIASDVLQGARRGYMKIPGQFADNLNGMIDWVGDKVGGEDDYRFETLDQFRDYWKEELNEYLPEARDTTAYKASEAVSNALVSFIGPFKALPKGMGVIKRGAIAEGGATLVQDPYEERLADIMKDVGPELTIPLFDAIRSKPDDPVPLAILKRAGENIGLGLAADGLVTLVGALRRVKNAKSDQEVAEATQAAEEQLRQLGKDIDQLEIIENGQPIKVPAGKPRVKPKKKSKKKPKETIEQMSDGSLKRTKEGEAPKVDTEEPPTVTIPIKDKIFDDEKVAEEIVQKVQTNNLDETRHATDTDLPIFNENHLAIQNSSDFNNLIKTVYNGYRKAKLRLSDDKVVHDVYEEQAEQHLKELGMNDFVKRLQESATKATEMGGIMYAGKVAINWFTKEMLDTATLYRNAVTKDDQISALARMYELETMLPEMGRITSYTKVIQESAARTTASGILDVRLPDDVMKFQSGLKIEERFAQLDPKHLKKLEAKVDVILEHADTVGRQKPDKETAYRILRIAKTDTSKFRLAHFLSERFRRNILFNVPTIGINAVMNLAETVIRPVGDLIGNTLLPIGNKIEREHLNRELKGQIGSILFAMKFASQRAYKALIDNQAILDPRITQFEGQMDRGTAEYLFSGSDAQKGFLENSKLGKALATVINITGKPGEMSYRLLNATDEFYKQANYFAKRFGQEVAELDDATYNILRNGTSKQKEALKNQIRERIFKDSYEDGGQALGGAKFGQQEAEESLQQGVTGLTKKKQDALQYAREVTFTNEDLFDIPALAQFRSLVDTVPFLQVFFPFIRTPTNIIAKGMRLTPGPNAIGLFKRLNSEDPMIASKARGEVALTTAIAGSVAMLAMSGRMSGRGPRDWEQRKLWLKQNQPYSIKLGDTWYDYGRFSPYSIPLKVMADIMDTVKYAPDGEAFANGEVEDYMGAYIINLANVLREESFTRGLKNLTTIVEETTTGEFTRSERILEDIFASMVSVKAPGQAINWTLDVAGQVGNELRGDQRNKTDRGTEIQGASTEGSFAALGDKVLRNFGGQTSPKYNWVTGEKAVKSQYNILAGIIPVKTREVNNDFLLKHLINLNDPGLSSEPDTTINDVGLSAEQQSKYQLYMGTKKLNNLTLSEALLKVIQSKGYQQLLSNTAKAKELKKIKRKFRIHAENELMREYPALGRDINKARLNAKYKRQLGIELIR